MDNQAVIYHVTQQPTRKTGIATYPEGMEWLGIKSRTTAIKKERLGLIPRRLDLGMGRVGWRWSDLYAWSDKLTAAEGGKDGQ